MQTETIIQLATEARAYFERGERESKDTKERIWKHKDNAPQWVRDMCYQAHANGDMLPDDFRYAFMVDALDILCDADEDADLEDLVYEYIEADIYTADLLRWLSSSCQRIGYCDDALDETGGDVKHIESLIALGQEHEKREVYDTVLAFLRERAETLDDGDVDEEE